MIDRAVAVETTRLVRTSTVLCAVAALLCMLGGAVVQHPAGGALAGLGVLVGAANAHLAKALLRTGLPVPTASLIRLGGLTAVVLLIGLLAGLDRAWLIVLGVGVAQLVMAVTAILEMTRR